jgi:hypothetical protein
VYLAEPWFDDRATKTGDPIVTNITRPVMCGETIPALVVRSG